MKNTWKKLIKDERSFGKRLLISFLLGFSIPFTFLIIGILDLYMNNIGMFPFSFSTLVPPVLLAALICCVILTLISCLFKGFLYDIVLSLYLGFLLGGYLQGNFLNINLGELTGDAIDWSQYTAQGYLNTVLWVIILLSPLLLRIFLNKAWKKIIIIVPAVIMAMQGVGLFSTAMQTDFSSIKQVGEEQGYLSVKGITDLSSENNVLVFLLDRLDGKYIDLVKEQEPAFFDDLEGFTQYTNNISMYCRTYPSVANMLTGEVSYFDKPAVDFFTEAYQKGSMLPKLRELNFTTKLYMSAPYTFNRIEQLEGLADNMYNNRNYSIDQTLMLKRMTKFSAFRYAPHALKYKFWLSPDTFLGTVIEESRYPQYETDTYDLSNELEKTPVSLTEAKNNFMFLHLPGCHGPYNLNPDGTLSGETTNLESQTLGSFSLIKQYMEQMKELGVYDSATIIITGDHGESSDGSSPDTYKTTGLFVKQSGAAREPLKISDVPVASENFRGTILRGAGIDDPTSEKAVWELTKDDNRNRKYLYQIGTNEGAGGRIEEYDVKGNAENFNNWSHVKDYPLLFNVN